MRLHKTYRMANFKALPEEGEGTFEAIVAVFGNVDLVGDRVVKGAFAKNLKAWGESGDPIPVIWSHQWEDPFAHVGVVLEAEERDEGLYVKGQLDMGAEFAAQVYRKLQQRAIREFSFAYDVVREKTASDGANELLELELIEVGPTLKGANPATQLVGVKAARVLSKTNELKLREALKMIEEVVSAVEDTEEPKGGEAEVKAEANEEEPVGANSEEPGMTPALASLRADLEELDG